VPEDVIRLLMLRDSETKGKKLLFDSMTTTREDLSNKNVRKCNFQEFDQITDGFGYKASRRKFEKYQKCSKNLKKFKTFINFCGKIEF
jgi:hypothetical protein